MPLHPSLGPILDVFNSVGGLDFGELSAPEARARMQAMRAPVVLEPVAKTENVTIPGPASGIPARVYTPTGSGPFPVLLWFHGGGWVIGDLDGADLTCTMLANRGGCVVVSVDYRLAPEAKFPAAADDSYAATQWVIENAAKLNVDAGRVAVGGDSAGGNLAAVVSLMARDRRGPKISHQLLVYPVTERNFGTASYRENATGYLLTKGSMEWFWNHYLNDDGEATNPYASPMLAASHADLPPATVITAEFDPLRDEGEAYGAKLSAAGVPVVTTRYDGMIHGFFGMSAAVDDAKRAVDQAGAALRDAFATR